MIKVKKNGAYSDIVGMKFKKSGIYTAVVGCFVKVGGAYQNMLSSVVTLAQTQSPYTLQASDSGKTLVPATTAEFSIITPGSLGATFTCTISPTGSYPTTISEAGIAQVSNSGFRVSNQNNMANNIVMPGNTATISASSANVLGIAGNVGRWQQVVSHTGYSDSNTGGNLQITGVTLHEVKGNDGDYLTGIKLVFLNTVGLSEIAPTGPAQFAASVAYPVGSTPVRATFGGLTTATVTGKAEVISDLIVLSTPVLINNASPNSIEVRSWNGVTTGDGAQSGKGSTRTNGITDINKKEFFGATTAAGMTKQSVLSDARTSLVDTLIATSANGSNQIFRPAAIIGVTATGATAGLVDSRAEPSNGDSPTVGGTPYSGEFERVWGRQNYPMLNLACASAGVTTLMQSTGVYRRGLLRFASRGRLNGVQNDLNKGSIAGIRMEVAKLKNDPYFAGKPLVGHTTSPFTTSTDQWTTTANQSAANAANCQLIEDWNNALVAGTIPEFSGSVDLRPVFTTNVSSALSVWKVAAGSRTVTDGVMTAGSNIFTSVTASFTSADTGYKISITGWGNAGGVGTGVMTYISPTQVSITGTRSMTAYNSVGTFSGQNCFIRSQDITTDGTHGSQKQGEMIEAAVLTLP